ncbi:MAG: hypothetical protein SFU98_20850 [Leptospiraceae bacterium]|nr:hypothetical protein [Leptospiraceae bacterium]
MDTKDKKSKMTHEYVVRIIREHAEMLRLLETFPETIDELGTWIKKKKLVMEKMTKKSPS